MKILYLTEDISTSGGIEKLLYIKSEYFRRKFNYQVSIISERQCNDTPFFNSQSTTLNIDNRNRFILFYWLEMFKVLFKIRKIQKKESYDIIISTGFYIDLLLPLLKIRTNCKVIREFHTAKKNTSLYEQRKMPTDFLRRLVRRIYIALERISLSYVDRLVILTKEDSDKWDNKNIEIIPNFITIDEVKTSSCESKKVISVGRLAKQKGYEYLIEIWKKISYKYPDWVLEIYGVGEEKENLELIIQKQGLEDTFILKGYTNNIHEKYSEASIYVMSSRVEGMPLVLLEAMASGLPVISFACPTGPKDLVKEGDSGFLIDCFDLDSFAQRLEELILSFDKRKRMGESALKNTDNYSKEKVMLKWKKLFDELCGVVGE